MDILTFIFNIVDTLAWPVTTLISLCIFIRKGPQIAKAIKSIKYKDLEINLREEFTIVKDIVYEIRGEENIKELPTPPLGELQQLAILDPSLAILKIWQELEVKITQLFQHNGLKRFTNPSNFVSRLVGLDKITSNDAELFKRLHKIRNDVVHVASCSSKTKLTIAEVVEYKNFVDTFIERLESIRQEDGYINID